jgi:hypothetical protein
MFGRRRGSAGDRRHGIGRNVGMRPRQSDGARSRAERSGRIGARTVDITRKINLMFGIAATNARSATPISPAFGVARATPVAALPGFVGRVRERPSMPAKNARIDLVGRQFERLTVIAYVETKNRAPYWLCRCNCGDEIVARGSALASGNTKSCGCLVRDNMSLIGQQNATHNLSRTPEYRSWSRMIHRCYFPTDNRFEYYGARGISVCDRWRNSFEAFLEDMGPKPPGRPTIDRFPNKNGNYEPSNCRWATYREQNLNRNPMPKRRRMEKAS